jgi:hypothetical protein
MSNRGNRLVALPLASILGALALLASAGTAAASHTVTAFSLAPASTQAGASVDASSSTSLSYADATDDVKKTIGHFAAGLLANPEAVPHCPQALYLADTCPPDTLIGSSEADIDLVPNLGVVTTVTGRIYNQELLGGEAGRLGIIVDTVPSKTFLTAPFYVRSNGDYGLDGVLDDLPRTIAGVANIQIKRLKFTLFGTVNGRNFTRGPTSCSLHTSTGEAFAYDHPEAATGPSSSYTPTGCDMLPFNPAFTMSVGARGSNGFARHPPLRVTVTQMPGEAGILGNGVTLPVELTPNTAAFGSICMPAELASDTCPATSQVGTASATSPFVATPLAGAVYLVQEDGVVLPGLVADLRGRVRVKVKIANSIVGGRQIKSTVNGLPDLPIGSFSLALDGGSKGVLTDKTDLCFSSASRSRFRAMKAQVSFTGQNGASTASTPRVAVNGCPPSSSISLSRARGRRPVLKLRIQRHPDAPKIQRVELKLPKQLRIVKRRLGKGASAQAASALGRGNLAVRGRRTLLIQKLPAGGAASVSLTLSKRALKPGVKLRRALRKGKRRTLRFRVTTLDVSGRTNSFAKRVRPKR